MTEKEKVELWYRVMGFSDEPAEVESLFEEDSECYRIWEKIYACEQWIGDEHRRMFEVLDKPMDKELERDFEIDLERRLERMFDYYNEICKIISLRMFDYGVEYGKTGTPLL